MITAHTGCDGTPDNSEEYLRYALGLGVDAAEVDVRRGGENELILSHDETAEKAFTLREAFRLLKKQEKGKLNCDLKQKGLEEDVFRLAREEGVEDRLIFTGDVDPFLFRKGEKRYPEVIWYANLEVFRPRILQPGNRLAGSGEMTGRLTEVLKEVKEYEAAGINWHFSLAELIWDRAKQMGVGISVWTVDEEELLRFWLSKNVDNITTRRPSRLISLKKEMNEQADAWGSV